MNINVLEESKEIVRAFRETNDFKSFKKSMYELDIDKDRSEQDKMAWDYLLRNISIEESANLF